MVKRLHLSSARLRKNEHKHRESFITFLFVIKEKNEGEVRWGAARGYGATHWREKRNASRLSNKQPRQQHKPWHI